VPGFAVLAHVPAWLRSGAHSEQLLAASRARRALRDVAVPCGHAAPRDVCPCSTWVLRDVPSPCPCVQVLPDVPALPEAEQYLRPIPVHLAAHPRAPDQVSAWRGDSQLQKEPFVPYGENSELRRWRCPAKRDACWHHHTWGTHDIPTMMSPGH